jgi:hypothetical protein
MSTDPRRTLFPEAPLEYVKQIYCGFVQGLFGSLSRESGYHWDADENLNQIVVKDSNSIIGQELNYRPGVLFARGPVQSQTLGFNDRMGYDPSTGQVTKSILIPGTMNINVVSRIPQEAENLAWVISEAIWVHKQMFMDAGFMDIGRFVVGAPTAAGSLVEGDGGDEWYAVVASSPFQFFRTTVITPLGHKIADNFKISTGAGSQAGVRPHPFLPGQLVAARRVSSGHGVTPAPVTYPKQPIQGPPGPAGPPGPSGGSTLERTADVTLSAYKVVYATAGDGAAYADSSVPAHGPFVLGITSHAASMGTIVQIIQSGEVEEATWSWTPNLPIFCGSNGTLTQTAPTSGWLRQIAYATSPTSVIVDIGPLFQLA